MLPARTNGQPDATNMRNLLRDLRFGFRALIQRPGFTLLVVLTLALGIGATSAVFSLIQGVLLEGPPYPEPERLVLVSSARTDGQPMVRPQDWAATQWQEWQQDAESLTALAAYRWTFTFWIQDDGSESLEGMWVSRDYFRVLGLEPVIGRSFHHSDTLTGAAPVVVLGYDTWQQKLGGDPDIVGKTIRLSRMQSPPTIVGVMPPEVRFLPSPSTSQEPDYDVDAQVDYWVPVSVDPSWVDQRMWNVVARLQPGATLESAQSELEIIVDRQRQDEPALVGVGPRLQRLTDEMNRDGQRVLMPLLGAAALVLIIACGNAAAMLLVRGLQRQQEHGVRSTLGAGRAALFRQVTIESLILALAGSGLGTVLALVVVRVFKLIGGPAIPRLDAVDTGWPVLACGLSSALLAAFMAGTLPAIRAGGLDPVQALKSTRSSAGRGERRLLSVVTVSQMALTLSLLVGAGLLIRTMVNLAQVPAGYERDRVLTMSVTAVEGGFQDFHVRALEQVSALAGVKAAAFAWGVPLTGNNWPMPVEIEGQPVTSEPGERLSLPLRSVTPGYFELLGVELVEGRDFRSDDTQDAPAVAIVNRALVERYFPDADALGKRLWLGSRDRPATRIVGVVADARNVELARPAEPEVYAPLWQWGAFSKHLVVRTESDPRAMVDLIRRQLRAVEPTVAVESVRTLEQIQEDSLAARTFAMQLLIGFAGVASLLTLGGVFGVLSLSVASRRHEIAIRSAVGAGRRRIRSLIFGEGLRLITIGVISGLLAAIALSRALDSFLYGIEPTDPATLVVVGALFAAVAFLACWLPARRAARVDPLAALRQE